MIETLSIETVREAQRQIAPYVLRTPLLRHALRGDCELLLKPEVSIYFGTHYLGSLLKKFQGQELLAAAAYNAGPHRIEGWLRANPTRPMDVFVEEIPKTGTGKFDKKVVRDQYSDLLSDA